MYAYDRVGYGHSDPRPDDEFTPLQNGLELIDLIEAVDERDVTVVGWSYGGAAAIDAAIRDPSRMSHLVLVGSAGPGIGDREEPPAVARLVFSRPVLRWMRSVPPLSRGLRRAMSEQAFSGPDMPDWWLPTLEANFALAHTQLSWNREGARVADLPDPRDMRGPDPTDVALPVLVVHGDDDRLVPMRVAEALHEHAPDSRLRVVEGGSHMLPVTHADLLADEIVAFDGI